jgi:hypothetical protein
VRRDIRIPAVAGAVATVALAAWAAASESRPWFMIGLISVAALGFVLLSTAARRSVALTPGLKAGEFTWLPALVFSALVGWYSAIVFPAPATNASGAPSEPDQPTRLHLAAPAAMAALLAVLLTASRVTDLPLLRIVAALALGFFGSLLIPVRPQDGAFLTRKGLQLWIALGTIALAIAMFLGWL